MEAIFAMVMTTVATNNQTPDDDIITEARLLFNKINQTTNRCTITGVQNEVSSEISRLENRLSEAKGDKAKFYICKACDLYCIIYKTPEERLSYLQKMITIIETPGADIPNREKALTRFKIADVLYDENKIEEAHTYIYNLYKSEPESFKELLSGYQLLVETSILLKKYDLAEKILNDEFSKSIELQTEPYCKFAHLNYAKLYLHKADYEKAITHIIETKHMRKSELNMLLEAQIRIYETIYFFLIGDVDYASQLITINLKFCEFHNIGDRSPEIKEIFNTVNELIQARLNNSTITIKTMDSLNRFQTGPWRIFGELLMRLPKKLSAE